MPYSGHTCSECSSTVSQSEYSSFSYLSQNEDSTRILDSGIISELEDNRLICIRLSPYEVEPWGASVNFDDDCGEWKIRTVDEGRQADKKGIESGFRIRSVNGIRLCRKTQQEIRDILENGLGCDIEFDTSGRSSVFRPEHARDWRLNSLEREESEMQQHMSELVRDHSERLLEKQLDTLPEVPRKHVRRAFSYAQGHTTSEVDGLKSELKLAWKEIEDLKESKASLEELVCQLNSRMNNLENIILTKLDSVPAYKNSSRSCTPSRASMSLSRLVHV